MNRSVEQVLLDARDTLETARFGLRLLCDNTGRERIFGLRILVVFGRAVTNVLQNLRTILPNFDADWYQGAEAAMRQDPLMRYFYALRTEVLKDGSLSGIGNDVRIVLGRGGGAYYSHRLLNPPRVHKGEPLEDISIEALSEAYLSYLEELIEQATKRFGTPRGEAPPPAPE